MKRIDVEIPAELADALHARIAAGRYADESEAVTASLRLQEEDERRLDVWLRGAVADAFDAVKNGSATLMDEDEVRQRLGLSS